MPSQDDINDLRKEYRESDSERENRLEHEEMLRQQEEELKEEDIMRNDPMRCPVCFGYRWIDDNDCEDEDDMCSCNPKCDYPDADYEAEVMRKSNGCID